MQRTSGGRGGGDFSGGDTGIVRDERQTEPFLRDYRFRYHDICIPTAVPIDARNIGTAVEIKYGTTFSGSRWSVRARVCVYIIYGVVIFFTPFEPHRRLWQKGADEKSDECHERNPTKCRRMITSYRSSAACAVFDTIPSMHPQSGYEYSLNRLAND